MILPNRDPGLHIVLISLHGLIRANNPELGRDVDTGGQVKYVLELAAELARRSDVKQVELVTRQIFDTNVAQDYATATESICDKAKIVRIPFGPKRYLRKELLWPYLDVFTDQMTQHFRRYGLPDLIHGHYADAGYAGAQLARVLHIPFVFTGHSLGRVKRQRMQLASKKDKQEMEQKYHFSTRVEAEELSLEVASTVVVSTNQEIEEQYELYQHYVPDRMEVIPPGVDLDSFRPATDADDFDCIARSMQPFLKDSDKPSILAMARPDERKNTKMLVKVFGESAELQERANLVLVLGTREDVAKLPPAQRSVLNEVLLLIDKYNLYGKVAYPKQVTPNLGPSLYRYVAKQGGVFVNPALTEPFGLTLLEAAASGLPIVATNDGGPRDIIANCQNGALVDPLDQAAITDALLTVLKSREQWTTWSKNGIKGATKHYSWAHHVDQYLTEVHRIVDTSRRPAIEDRERKRRLPEFDRLIITDLDATLTGDDDSLQEFCELIDSNPRVGFGLATGRRIDEARTLIKELNLPTPNLLIASAGTELYYGAELTPDKTWHKQIGFAWNPARVREILDGVEGLFLQSEKDQSTYKVSYTLDRARAPSVAKIRRMLREAGLKTKVVFSLDMFLDVLPIRGGNGVALRHLLYKWGFPPEQVLVAGDSGVDEEMLRGRTLGVVVGNYGPELKKLRKQPRIFFAGAHHAKGILEGIEYYNFLDEIVIPNEQAAATNRKASALAY